MRPPPPESDVLLRVRGTVQGVGFRPFVHQTAHRLGLHGWVRNDPEGVLIRAQGTAVAVASLLDLLAHAAPPASHVEGIQQLEAGAEGADPADDFVILESDLGDGRAALRASIPADLALCADCRRELTDPADRRFRYPFINCTQCGPRYSLIEALPYDRARTTMRGFTQCPACRREYEDPSSRRFHAEPNACPACGPQADLAGPDGHVLATGEAALAEAAWQIAAGRIVAVKGVGGYHLMCDAACEPAVAELRRRKQRDEKPLAVMFRDLAQLREHARVPPAAAALLTSPAAPIVLVARRPDSSLARSVAPGNPWVGALLPYAPLHVLLLGDLARPVVATSANLSDEPICTDNPEALRRLAGIADCFLRHDRPIARPVEDSVVRLTAGGAPILLRRARGFAPAPLTLPRPVSGAVLCVGGQMKNTVAVASGDQVTLSPHLGDLEAPATGEVFRRTIAMLAELYQARFTQVAHDLHPDYASTRFAAQTGLPLLGVQHHLAHVLAVLLEHNHPADDVLGVAWDGTGYGPDGTVWGGEFLRLAGNRAERFARLHPFRLAGGEAAVRDARRVAFALARAAQAADGIEPLLHLRRQEMEIFSAMLDRAIASPACSSMGRLFDGLGALLGLGRHNAFEGQVPLQVEAAATGAADGHHHLEFPVVPSPTPGARLELDWRPAVTQLLQAEGRAGPLALACHQGLVRGLVDIARRSGVSTVALTGGCFQNALLHHLSVTALTGAGFRVLVHRTLSPNDNSIAAGQALAACLGLSGVDLPAAPAEPRPA